MATQQTRSYHSIITLSVPTREGALQATFDKAFSLPAGCTRAEAYQAIRAEIVRNQPHFANADVIFFSLEPNEL